MALDFINQISWNMQYPLSKAIIFVNKELNYVKLAHFEKQLNLKLPIKKNDNVSLLGWRDDAVIKLKGNRVIDFLETIDNGLEKIINKNNTKAQTFIYEWISNIKSSELRKKLITKFENGKLTLRNILFDYYFEGHLVKKRNTWYFSIGS